MGRFSDELQKQLGLTDEQMAEAKAEGQKTRENLEKTGSWLQNLGCVVFLIGIIGMLVVWASG